VDYHRSWFPELDSYWASKNRLNLILQGINTLAQSLCEDFAQHNISDHAFVLASKPIINRSGKRAGKMVRKITEKGNTSTKGMYTKGWGHAL
jgi:hypothetical protein